MDKKYLNVTMICKAVYNSSILVPENLTLKEAIRYAKEHLSAIPVGEMEWMEDMELDEENCGFDEIPDVG